MLATLVIGLREGLEASLIVGIIAAFLRRTDKPLRPMWIGVAIAVALSIAVGVTLQLVSASLPQAAQEGMESVIGFAAVAIVTGMIGWMNTHARDLRSELEQHAAEALRDGTAWALVIMAFLAVLKEGFETSVFLLAAFQASTSVVAASGGAVLGVVIAVGIGIGIFRGGVRLNLGRFFRITGVFLVFVAAGLVLSSLRSAHEAGWITIGQQTTLDLSWLAPAGSVQAALFTGVLGIPADPRVIEVAGWLAYLVPTMLYLLWPIRHRPSGTGLARFRVVLASVLLVAAVGLAVAVPLPGYQPGRTIAIVDSTGNRGTAQLTSGANRWRLGSSFATAVESDSFTLASLPTVRHDGLTTRLRSSHGDGSPTGLPTTLTLTQLVGLNGGRIPIGMSAIDDPGPFDVRWTTASTTRVWISGTGIADAASSGTTIATLSGGGLASTRTLTPASVQPVSWHATTLARAAIADRSLNAAQTRAELMLWKLWLPIVLLLAALVLVGYAIRARIRTTSPTSPSATTTRSTTKEHFA